MKEEFLCPLPCAMVDRIIGFCHSISLIYIAHAAVIILHNLQLYGLPIIIAEITLCWWIMYVCQNTYISFVRPQYGCQVTPGPYLKVTTIGTSFSWGLSPVACPSCWVRQCHNSKFVLWPSHRISPGTRSNCPCTVCGRPCIFFVNSDTVA